jgi:hypothetical protein
MDLKGSAKKNYYYYNNFSKANIVHPINARYCSVARIKKVDLEVAMVV